MKNEQQTSLPEREEPVAATTMRPSQNSKSAERVLNKPQKPFSAYWLQKAVEDAYYLHSYSITTGKKIPDKVSQAIIDLKHLYDQGAEKTIDAAMETRFRSAYRELAATMFPVTVESLRDTEDIQFDARRPFISRVQLSKAH